MCYIWLSSREMQQLCIKHFERRCATHVFIQFLGQYNGHNACSQTASIHTAGVNSGASCILLQPPTSVMPEYDMFWAIPFRRPRLPFVRPTCLVPIKCVNHLPHL